MYKQIQDDEDNFEDVDKSERQLLDLKAASSPDQHSKTKVLQSSSKKSEKI